LRSQSPNVRSPANCFKVVFWSLMCVLSFVIDGWAAHVFRGHPWTVLTVTLVLSWFVFQVFDLIDHVICKSTGNAKPSLLRQFAYRRNWI
jgi:hypothetical protein